MRLPGPTHRNIYVSSQAAAERTLESIQNWIEKHLRLKVNTAKSGTGRTEERQFLGFRLDREGRIEVAPESIERFKAKVREKWRANQSRTSRELRDDWVRYVRGWWGYYQLAAVRKPIYQLEGWIRRHIRKCFWLRWHDRTGREHALRRLGSSPATPDSADGPGGLAHGEDCDHARGAEGQHATSFRLPAAIRSCGRVRAAEFNRRMRKTARPVVWEVVSRRRESVLLYER